MGENLFLFTLFNFYFVAELSSELIFMEKIMIRKKSQAIRPLVDSYYDSLLAVHF